MRNPKPEILYKKAIEAYKKKQYREAIALLDQTLSQDPDFIDAWLLLGGCLSETTLYSSAIAAFRRLLELNPKASGIYSRIGFAFEKLNILEQSLYYHELAIKEKPKDSRTWMHYSIALRKANRKQAALKACERSLMFDPSNVVSKANQAMIHLSQGNYKLGWKELEVRMQDYPEGFRNRPTLPLWTGEALTGPSKAILLMSEQGFGDTLMISRFVPMVKERLGPDGKVILLVMEPVFKLLNHLPNVDFSFISPVLSNSVPPFDCYLNLMSLPYVLNIQSLKDIPPPTRFEHPEIRTIIDTAKQKIMPAIKPYLHRFKVGIVWSGSVTNKADSLRSVPLDYFLPLLEIPGIELFSFQKGPREREIQQSGLNPLVHNLGQYFSDFSDTAAAIECMDLMITVDTSVAHLAGSLNKPIWLLLNYVPYWLWLEKREDTPWYPSMTLYRQKTEGDWAEVFKRVQKALTKISLSV